jgi:hypothetical protein
MAERDEDEVIEIEDDDEIVLGDDEEDKHLKAENDMDDVELETYRGRRAERDEPLGRDALPGGELQLVKLERFNGREYVINMKKKEVEQVDKDTSQDLKARALNIYDTLTEPEGSVLDSAESYDHYKKSLGLYLKHEKTIIAMTLLSEMLSPETNSELQFYKEHEFSPTFWIFDVADPSNVQKEMWTKMRKVILFQKPSAFRTKEDEEDKEDREEYEILPGDSDEVRKKKYPFNVNKYRPFPPDQWRRSVVAKIMKAANTKEAVAKAKELHVLQIVFLIIKISAVGTRKAATSAAPAAASPINNNNNNNNNNNSRKRGGGTTRRRTGGDDEEEEGDGPGTKSLVVVSNKLLAHAVVSDIDIGFEKRGFLFHEYVINDVWVNGPEQRSPHDVSEMFWRNMGLFLTPIESILIFFQNCLILLNAYRIIANPERKIILEDVETIAIIYNQDPRTQTRFQEYQMPPIFAERLPATATEAEKTARKKAMDTVVQRNRTLQVVDRKHYESEQARLLEPAQRFDQEYLRCQDLFKVVWFKDNQLKMYKPATAAHYTYRYVDETNQKKKKKKQQQRRRDDDDDGGDENGTEEDEEDTEHSSFRHRLVSTLSFIFDVIVDPLYDIFDEEEGEEEKEEEEDEERKKIQVEDSDQPDEPRGFAGKQGGQLEALTAFLKKSALWLAKEELDDENLALQISAQATLRALKGANLAETLEARLVTVEKVASALAADINKAQLAAAAKQTNTDPRLLPDEALFVQIEAMTELTALECHYHVQNIISPNWDTEADEDIAEALDNYRDALSTSISSWELPIAAFGMYRRVNELFVKYIKEKYPTAARKRQLLKFLAAPMQERIDAATKVLADQFKDEYDRIFELTIQKEKRHNDYVPLTKEIPKTAEQKKKEEVEWNAMWAKQPVLNQTNSNNRKPPAPPLPQSAEPEAETHTLEFKRKEYARVRLHNLSPQVASMFAPFVEQDYNRFVCMRHKVIWQPLHDMGLAGAYQKLNHFAGMAEQIKLLTQLFAFPSFSIENGPDKQPALAILYLHKYLERPIALLTEGNDAPYPEARIDAIAELLRIVQSADGPMLKHRYTYKEELEVFKDQMKYNPYQAMAQRQAADSRAAFARLAAETDARKGAAAPQGKQQEEEVAVEKKPKKIIPTLIQQQQK